ncbi:MAG: 3-methyl-2-oxobutanoate hydroxymethyltransferase [Planctomycetes bacterium]|nr:3-methyl-2-oxobutanoate hydroxymethyltransferase [Planctomycetota bacterium]MCL4731801.1 3-methyl-2-oxobutanoate hydroxymethyltransferase [Planctomycetota bacterium]
MARRLTTRDIRQRAEDGGRISMITAYDAFSARLADRAEIDIALVGDSVGTTLQGRPDTLGVEMAHMLYHTEIVARCTRRALVVGDMPFGSYQCGDDRAVENAVAFLRAGANAVKLEGGTAVAPLVARLTRAGVPVMGHVGFTPQSIHQTGGPRVNKDKTELLSEARALQQAGVFSIVLEMVPAAVAKEVTAALDVPTIGIGAGPHTDGQVLVFYDLLGFSPDFSPKFLKRYMDFDTQALEALRRYKADVESGRFPAKEHSY